MIAQVKDILLRNGFEEIREATLNEQKNDHIDLVTITAGKKRTVEVKNRTSDYGDLLIETWSNTARKTRGWVFTCRADYLAYIVFKDDILEKGRLLDMKKLHNWWVDIGISEDYPRHYGHTDKLYETENRAVPWNDLPQDIILLDFWSENK